MSGVLAVAGPRCQRWRAQTTSFRDVRTDEPVRRGRYEVGAIPESAARRFVETHHYAGSMPAASRCYGMVDRADGRLVGAIVLGVPMSRAVLTRPFPELDPYVESLELSRLVLLDEVPANGETHFLGGMLSLAGEVGIRGLVSFSDPVERTTASGRLIKRGHQGTVYRAANSAYLGLATARSLTLLPDGTVFSDRSASKIRGRERGWRYASEQLVTFGARPLTATEDARSWLAAALAAVGARRLRHPGNHRFAFRLGNRTERRHVALGLPEVEYTRVGC